jgi:hypothetical protein
MVKTLLARTASPVTRVSFPNQCGLEEQPGHVATERVARRNGPNMYLETLKDGTSNPGTIRAPKGVVGCFQQQSCRFGISQHMIRISNNVG